MGNGKLTEAKSVYVLSEIDGFRYKLVMEGDVNLLTVAKIKRYLQNATGLCSQQQELLLDGRILRDDECGGDVGLVDGALLRMRHSNTARHVSRCGASVPQCSSQSLCRGGAPTTVRLSGSCSSTVGMSTPRRTSNDRCSHGSSGEVARGDTTSDARSGAFGGRLQGERRRGSDGSCGQRLREEIEELRETVARLTMEKNNAERLVKEKWEAKVDELVKELDVLREERRKLYREQALVEQEHRETVRSLKEQIQSQQQKFVRREEALERRERGCLHCMKATITERVDSSLKQLSVELGIPHLQLDNNDTCMLPLEDGTNILITLDTQTERLFMYAVIANSLPFAVEHRLRLFEALLEGALLGREMAGGAVGICLKNNLVIMNVCVNIAHTDEYALAAVARPFIASVQHWIGVCQGIKLLES